MTAARFSSKAFEREECRMARITILMVAAFAACLGTPCESALAVETGVKKILPARVEATSDAKIMKVTLTPKAAERLGIPRSSLYQKIKKHQIRLSSRAT